MSLISLDCSRPFVQTSIFLLVNYESNFPCKFNTEYLNILKSLDLSTSLTPKLMLMLYIVSAQQRVASLA